MHLDKKENLTIIYHLQAIILRLNPFSFFTVKRPTAATTRALSLPRVRVRFPLRLHIVLHCLLGQPVAVQV